MPASAVRTVKRIEDLTLDTIVRDWARLEEDLPQDELDEFREYYVAIAEDVCDVNPDADYGITEDSESAVEVEYELPLRTYLAWPGDTEYERETLVNAIANTYHELGIEESWAAETPIRDAVEDRLDALELELSSAKQG